MVTYVDSFFSWLNKALNFNVSNLLLVVCFVILIIIAICHSVSKKNRKKEDEYIALYKDSNFRNNAEKKEQEKVVNFLWKRHILEVLQEKEKEEIVKNNELVQKLHREIEAEIASYLESLFDKIEEKTQQAQNELSEAEKKREEAETITANLESEYEEYQVEKNRYKEKAELAEKEKKLAIAEQKQAKLARSEFEKKKNSLDSLYAEKEKALVDEYKQKKAAIEKEQEKLNQERLAFEKECETDRNKYQLLIENYLSTKRNIENMQEQDMESFNTDLEYRKENPGERISRDDYLSFNCNAY